ncbi:hypothetical protein HRI_004469600 [Hibiscus trionum]|uniref:RING-type E3 ubiquitin transferase n=1 Tax=Hibiscus trionum TaxID=183268 RepID=A0A9W7MMU6_HIBTR|nr:hypothetical protein HRI_004469600 [Hibiscus trionum]
MQSQGDQGSNSRETPTLRPFLENIGMNPNDGSSDNQGTIAPSVVPGQGQSTGSGPLQLDLNEPLQLTVDLSRAERSSDNQQILASGQSRLLCKRRTPEVPQPQNHVLINISTAASSSNNNTHLARHVAAPAIQIGQTDNFQRNTRLRTSVSQRNSQQMSVRAHPAMLHQHQQEHPIVVVPNPLQAPLPCQYWNGPTMPARGHPTFDYPPTMTQSANMNSVNRNPSFLRNLAASSGIQSGPGMYNSPFSSLGYRQSSMAEQTAERIQSFLDRAEALRMAHNFPFYDNASFTVEELEMIIMNRFHGTTPRSGAMDAERLGGDDFLLSSQIAEQRRRLMNQLRNYLRVVHRTGGLQMEDATEMGRSFLLGMYALECVDADMHVDVEYISYEELLGPGVQRMNFSLKLNVGTIKANLRRRRFQPISMEPTAEAEQCCICQEDYANGEELGKLDCGHDFHFDCIKEWLRRKNQCPICKKVGLAVMNT